MSAFLVASYRVTNPDGFAPYPERSIPTVIQHGGEILAADFSSEIAEGPAPHTTIILKFADKDALHRWYQSDEYQAIVHLRRENTEGSVVFIDEFAMPDEAGPKPWERRADTAPTTTQSGAPQG